MAVLHPGSWKVLQRNLMDCITQPSAPSECRSSNTLSGLTGDRRETFWGEWRPRGKLSAWFRLWGAEGGAVPVSPSAVAPSAVSVASMSAAALALQEKGHIPNQMYFHFLEKTILLVISVYLKYFRIIITKGTSGHRAKDRARDVNPQATWDRLKRNFYNFENISLLFPLVSPNHTVFITYQKTLTTVNVCGMLSMCQALC